MPTDQLADDSLLNSAECVVTWLRDMNHDDDENSCEIKSNAVHYYAQMPVTRIQNRNYRLFYCNTIHD